MTAALAPVENAAMVALDLGFSLHRRAPNGRLKCSERAVTAHCARITYVTIHADSERIAVPRLRAASINDEETKNHAWEIAA
jgi:hypothetical protein